MIEILIAIVVLSILLGLGVPSFQSLLRQNRMVSNTNQFIAAINLARSEAINRGVTVDVTADGGDWNNGWTVAVSGGGPVLRVFDNPLNTPINGDTVIISFPSTGIRTAIADNNFTVCDGGDNGRQIRISATGRPVIDTKDPC